MPYITQEDRPGLNEAVDVFHRALVNLEIDNPDNCMEGNINYAITRLLRMVYGTKDNTRYTYLNDVTGLLMNILLQHYITQAVPYEAQKEFENGDVEVPYRATMVEETVVKNPVKWTGPECLGPNGDVNAD